MDNPELCGCGEPMLRCQCEAVWRSLLGWECPECKVDDLREQIHERLLDNNPALKKLVRGRVDG